MGYHLIQFCDTSKAITTPCPYGATRISQTIADMARASCATSRNGVLVVAAIGAAIPAATTAASAADITTPIGAAFLSLSEELVVAIISNTRAAARNDTTDVSCYG